VLNVARERRHLRLVPHMIQVAMATIRKPMIRPVQRMASL
jgi:hypothetical protein